MIYLDNAATTGKKPDAVIKAVEGALRNLSANPGRSGHSLSILAAEAVYSARKKATDLFGAPDESRVIFTANCTHSLNIALKGVLRFGDHVVTSSLEHNAVMRPLEALNKEGTQYDIAEVIFGDPEATVRSFERLLKENTKAVVCTHASNVTGEILPIGEIGALCHKHGILFIVDAAQTAGVLEINMGEQNIDFLCIAPHKGLYAPMGTGILIAGATVENTIIEGGTGTESINLSQPLDLPERLESGTVNLPGIAGIAAGIDFVTSKGIQKIYGHEMDLMGQLYHGLSKISGIIIYSGFPKPGSFAPVMSINVRGLTSTKTAELLDNKGIAVRAGLHCAPSAHKRLGTVESGTVRVCTSVFNNSKEIETFCDVIRNISARRDFY